LKWNNENLASTCEARESSEIEASLMRNEIGNAESFCNGCFYCISNVKPVTPALAVLFRVGGPRPTMMSTMSTL
jgi:hypothetical protein